MDGAVDGPDDRLRGVLRKLRPDRKLTIRGEFDAWDWNAARECWAQRVFCGIEELGTGCQMVRFRCGCGIADGKRAARVGARALWDGSVGAANFLMVIGLIVGGRALLETGAAVAAMRRVCCEGEK
jgi:hypothetical protein